jgi:hypothetical protein
MKDLLCLVYVSEKVGKKGMPLKVSYSYRYKKCKCDNCTTYRQYCGKMFNSKNKEKNAKKKKAYYEKNKKEIRERQIIYELKNKDKVREYKKKYYEENKESINKRKKEYFKVYSELNKEKIKMKKAQYYQENLEKVREQKKKSQRLHQDTDRAKNRRRRAQKRNNGYLKYKESEVLEKYGTNCYLCNKPIDLNATRKCGSPGWEYGLHIEHYVDIALGGPDTLENVRPAHGICNLKKKPVGMV